MKILKVLKDPVRVIVGLGVAFLFFDLQYYLMSTLPGEVDQMCVVGGDLTTLNVIFAGVMSLLTGLMVAGVMALYSQRRSTMVGGGALSGLALLVGTFTVFCTTCTIPVVSFLGLSVGLTVFTDFNLEFKIVSFILMLCGIYLLNRQINES